MEFALAFLILPCLTGGACALIARKKRRHVLSWFVLGVVFNVLGLVALALLSTPSAEMDGAAGDERPLRLLAFLAFAGAGAFFAFIVLFAANGGAGGSVEVRPAAWQALGLYLLLYIPLLMLLFKKLVRS